MQMRYFRNAQISKILLKLPEIYQRKLLNIAKLTLVLSTLCFIVYKLVFAYNIPDILNAYSFTWTPSKTLLVLTVSVLILPNIGIESLKWRLIIQQYESISWLQSVQSVSAGIALGIITPNRIGDFSGKALFLETYDKFKGAVVSFIGSIAQTLAIVFCGSIGMWLFMFDTGVISGTVLLIGFIGIALGLGILYYIYLHIHWLNRVLKWKKAAPYIHALTHYASRDLTYLFLLSLLRFAIFNIQYFILLQVFDVAIPAHHAFPALAAIFGIQTFVPSFLLIEMGVRGATALYFLGMFSTHMAGILLAAYSLWILNIMLPGLIGLYFIVKMKARSTA